MKRGLVVLVLLIAMAVNVNAQTFVNGNITLTNNTSANETAYIINASNIIFDC